jgi:ankyrin repeat protein
MASILLDKGANPNIEDNVTFPPLSVSPPQSGYTALGYAFENDDPTLVTLLLDKGANPNIPHKASSLIVPSLIYIRMGKLLFVTHAKLRTPP